MISLSGDDDITDAAMGFAQAYGHYRGAGFTNVLPLPAGKKKPVPAGFTGTAGAPRRRRTTRDGRLSTATATPPYIPVTR